DAGTTEKECAQVGEHLAIPAGPYRRHERSQSRLQQLAGDTARNSAGQPEVVLQVMAHLMKYRTKRPRIDHPVIWKLDQRERIQLAAESPERNAAPERSRREAGAHVREGWRCGDRPRDAQPGEGHLVTIQRDAIATDQPIGKLALPLAEQFEIKVPDSLDGLDPVMADLFASNQLLKVCSIRILGRDLAGAGNPVSQLHQLRPQGRQQLIHRLQVTLTGRRRPGSEFASAKGAERG